MKTVITNQAAAASVNAAAAPVSATKSSKSKKAVTKTAAPVEVVPDGKATVGYLIDLFLSTYQTDKKKAKQVAKQTLDGDLNLEQRKAALKHMGITAEPTFENVYKAALDAFKKQSTETKSATEGAIVNKVGVTIVLPEGTTSKRGYANKGLTYERHGKSYQAWDNPKMKAGDTVGFKLKGVEMTGTLGWVHVCREGAFAHIKVEGMKNVVRSVKTITVPVVTPAAPEKAEKKSKAKK